MAFLAGAPPAAATSIRASLPLTSSRRRTDLSVVVKATSSSSSSHPLLASLRYAASAAALLAATSPALASVPSPPPPLDVTAAAAVAGEDSISEGSASDANATPCSLETLVEETALLARRGDAAAALARLDAALAAASARDARLIMAQVLFVENKVGEAIAAYEELAREDPGDYRPVFCQGVIYRSLGREAEADLMFQKCRDISPEKFNASGAPAVETEGVEANA